MSDTREDARMLKEIRISKLNNDLEIKEESVDYHPQTDDTCGESVTGSILDSQRRTSVCKKTTFGICKDEIFVMDGIQTDARMPEEVYIKKEDCDPGQKSQEIKEENVENNAHSAAVCGSQISSQLSLPVESTDENISNMQRHAFVIDGIQLDARMTEQVYIKKEDCNSSKNSQEEKEDSVMNNAHSDALRGFRFSSVSLLPVQESTDEEISDIQRSTTSTCKEKNFEICQEETIFIDEVQTDARMPQEVSVLEEDHDLSKNQQEMVEESLKYDACFEDGTDSQLSSESPLPGQKLTDTDMSNSQKKTKRKTFPCEVCTKSFPSYYIEVHRRTHTKEKPFPCDICNKAFTEKNSLARHIRIHTKEKPFGCDVCNKAFSDRGTLTAHMRIHTKEKPFCCDLCNKTFSSKKILAVHMRIHTNEKPFTCDICNRAFAHKGTLVAHTRVHTKEKPFTCDFCSKSFSVKASLVTHTRIHTKEKPFICDVCSKAFSQVGALKAHRLIHTK